MSGAIISDDLFIVPGPQTRPEYRKLPCDLDALTRGFGIALAPQLQRDAAVLAFAIECADRLLDALPQADRRARFSAGIIASFRGETVFNDDFTPELAGWLARLKSVAERRGVHGEFDRIIRALLANSERMRSTRRHGRFIACAICEGRLMVELLLRLLGGAATPEFAAFMCALAGPANLADKLRDARRDFQRGEIAVKPSARFYARLGLELSRRTAGLLRVAAANRRLARWGIESLFRELVWFPFSKAHAH